MLGAERRLHLERVSSGRGGGSWRWPVHAGAGSGVHGHKGEDGGRGALLSGLPLRIAGVLGVLTGTPSAPHRDPEPELPPGRAGPLCRVTAFLEAGRAMRECSSHGGRFRPQMCTGHPVCPNMIFGAAPPRGAEEKQSSQAPLLPALCCPHRRRTAQLPSRKDVLAARPDVLHWPHPDPARPGYRRPQQWSPMSLPVS